MAAFNFPNSPSTNDIHTENGVSWKWNGTIWARVASAGDTIEKGNTKVEVIDTGSDGHIKFTTEGTERLRIHENGTISTNVDNDSYEFTIQGKTGGSPTLWLRDGGTTGTPRVIFGDTGAAAVGAVAYANNGDYMQFKTGGVELVRFTNNAGSAGKVGIGSEIPVSKFDVADGTTGISFNRTNNTPEIHFRSNNVDECGEIRVGESSGGGVMDFKTKTTGGTLTTRLSIDTVGNLVTGAQASPTSSDNGNIYIKNASTIGSVGVAINYTTNAVFDSAWKYISNGGASKIIQNASLVSFNFVGSGSAGGGITWSEKVRITSTGRIGIGDNNPDRTVDIVSATGGNCDVEMRTTNNTGWCQLIFSDTDAGYRGAIAYNHQYDYMSLYTANTERLRIESNGNVHLGDWSDQGTVYGKARLNIRGEDEIATSFALTGSYLHLGGQESTMNGLYPISFGHTKANSTKASSYMGAKVTDSASYEKTALVFATRDSTSDNDPTERMRIHHQGYVTKSTMPYGYLRYGQSGGEGDSASHRCTTQSSKVERNGLSIDSNNRITVPYDGVYLFCAAINVAKNNGTTHRPRTDIKKNGSYLTRKEHQDLNGWHSFHMAHTLELSANDYLEIWVTGKCDSNDFQNASIVMLH